jgi:undecaprenyl pyrophosphate phosphatase UppP
MYDQLDQVPQVSEIEDRPGQRRRIGLSDPVFYAGCFALALLPASLAGLLLRDFIGEPMLFLAAVVLTTWVVTAIALVWIAAPLLRCRAIVAAGGLVSVAMCSLFLLE